MTDFAAQHVGTANPATRFFNWIWRGMMFLAENNTRVRALNRLNEISDAELEARGTNRAEVVRKMFADRLYI